MSIVFPKNNLPEAAQPWARQIQSQLSSIAEASTADEVNNAARDIQLNNSVLSLSAVVNELKLTTAAAAQAATDASAAAADALDAANAAQDAIDAASAAQSDANAALSDLGDIATGTGTFTINAGALAGGNVRDGVLELTSGSNSSITLFNGGVDINGPAAQVRVGTAGNGGTTVEGALTVTGGNIRAPGITATQFLQSEAQTGTGTVAANITAAGTLVRSSSSERYKQDIELFLLNYNDLLSLQAKRFRLKREVLEDENPRYYTGFIAEDIDKTSLKDFVSYAVKEDGSFIPDGVYYAELTAALLEAIKHQDTLIKSLTSRIETLENKDKV